MGDTTAAKKAKYEYLKLIQVALLDFIQYRPDCGFSAENDGFEWVRSDDKARASRIRFYLPDKDEYISAMKKAAVDCDALESPYGEKMELRLDMKTMSLDAIEKRFGHTDAMTIPGNKFTAVVFLYKKDEYQIMTYQKVMHELAHIYTTGKMKERGFDILQYNDPEWATKHHIESNESTAICAGAGGAMWLEFIAEYIAFDATNRTFKSNPIPHVRDKVIVETIQENMNELIGAASDFVYNATVAFRMVSYYFATLAGLFFSCEGAYDVLVDEFTINLKTGKPSRRLPAYKFGFSKRTAAGKELYDTVIQLLETLYCQFVSKESAYAKYYNDENLFLACPAYQSEQYVLNYDTAVDIGACICNMCTFIDEMCDE